MLDTIETISQSIVKVMLLLQLILEALLFTKLPVYAQVTVCLSWRSMSRRSHPSKER